MLSVPGGLAGRAGAGSPLKLAETRGIRRQGRARHSIDAACAGGKSMFALALFSISVTSRII